MILHEIHINGKDYSNLDKNTVCTCSYCEGRNKLHYGLNIPDHWKGWNSWYIIKYWDRRYIRWTNSWFKFIFKNNTLKK